MFVVIVDIVIKRDFIDQFREAVIRQGNNSLTLEEGCLGFDILQDPADPTRFTLYESYVDGRTFHEVHRATPHFAQYAASTAVWVECKGLRALRKIWPLEDD
jgi:quinol monooxygenase YgiN